MGALRRWLLTCVAFAAMAAFTWGRWPDAHIDFGLQAYEAWRVSLGEWPGRDFATLYGPLSPAINGLAFRVFGEGLWTLFALNLVLTAGATWLLTRLVARAFGQLAAQVGALVFLGVFAFGHVLEVGNYNFIAPYLHELTHGVLLALAAAWAMLEHRRTGQARWLAAAGLGLGLALLTKPEGALAAGAALLPGLWRLRGARRWLTVLVGVVLPPALATALYAQTLPLGDAVWAAGSAFRELGNPRLVTLPFFQKVAGLDDVPAAFLQLVRTTSGVALAVAAAALVARWGPRLRVVAFGLAAVATGGLLWWLGPNVAGAFPAGLLWLAVAAAVGPPATRPRDQARRSLWLLSAALLLKMGLHPRVGHYGFALAMPAGVFLSAALVRLLPSRAHAWWSVPAGGMRVALCGVVLGACAGPWFVTLQHARAKDTLLGEGRDAFYVDARWEAMQTALSALAQRTRPEDTVAVLPDGAMLGYLARRKAPTRFPTLAPPEFHAWGEDTVRQAFGAHPPDYVLLLQRDFEVPPRIFGVDYGAGLMGWWRGKSERVASFGPEPGQWEGEPGWVLYRRSTQWEFDRPQPGY